MPNCYDATSALPILTDFSKKDRQLSEQAYNQQEERRRKANESRGQKADEVVERLHRQLHDLLGAKKLAELREGIKRERLAFRDLWEPPVDLNRDYAKYKKASKRKIGALIRKFGTSPEKLREIGRSSDEKLREIITAADCKVVPGYNLAKNFDKWASLSPLRQLPLSWRDLAPFGNPSDPHRWFLFRPPFVTSIYRFAPQASSNFRVGRKHFLDESAGLVGNEATMNCDDAGSFDYASVTAEAQMVFVFDVPTTGLVEVLVDAQSTIGTHNLEIKDEWEASDAWCNQNNYLMMNVFDPNVPEPSLSLMSNSYAESDGDDLSMPRENLTRGQHYFAHLFSSGPVTAGRSVFISVGTRTFDIARANDMELHSKTNFQWFINSVQVRIAP